MVTTGCSEHHDDGGINVADYGAVPGDGSTGTAIHIGAESNWMEGVTSQDIVIRNNRFCHNSSTHDGNIDGASVVAIHVNAPKTDVPGLHQRILIEGNVVTKPDGPHVFTVKGAEDVTIRNNILQDVIGDALVVASSRRVRASANQGMADVFTQDGEPLMPMILPG